jgi:pectin methylesterase-like acyl-CoA thioesterase
MKKSTIMPTALAGGVALAVGLGSLYSLGGFGKLNPVAAVLSPSSSGRAQATSSSGTLSVGAGSVSASASTPVTTLTVAASGAEYKTVQAAINAVPTGGAAASYAIKIAAGTYHEVINVPSALRGLTIEGATGNPADVVITYGNAAGTANGSGGTLGTEGSATASFGAPDITVKGVTIANSFDRATATVSAHQAVAVFADADRQVYANDRFLGFQDTLVAWAPEPADVARQYYYDDFIEGATDFLCGDATAVFDHDNIQLVNAGSATGGLNGFITAAATSSAHAYGFLITASSVNGGGSKADTYYLGRPWHPFTDANPQVVVRNTTLPAAIKHNLPWTDMSGYSWTSARFSSYDNTGRGSVYASAAESPQLTSAQAAQYTAQKYLAGSDGWAPVPSAAASSASAAPSAASADAVTATGDSRTVTQPAVPSTVCATVKSDLAGSDGSFSTATETTPPDTSRIQAAINSCERSSSQVAVELTTSGSDGAFVSGPLTIGAGVVLVLEPGATLYASRNAADYGPHCGTITSSSEGCTPFITVNGDNSGIDGVRTSSGQGVIDGRGGDDILGTSTSWWALATEAQTKGGDQNNFRLIETTNASNFTLYDIDLENSPSFHVVYQGGTGFTAWGVYIHTPETARNTDGIDPGDGARDITVEDSYIADGDDGIAIKGGTATSNISIIGDHLYGTHGISIGSETNGGVTNVLVRDDTINGTGIDGTTSASAIGLRIKSDASRGGKVSDVSYADICMTGLRNPLDFDTHYSTATGSLIPYFTGIQVNGAKVVSSVSGAKSVFDGYSAAYPLGIDLEHVALDTTASTAEYASVGLDAANVTPSGTGVSTHTVTATGTVPTCTFPPYPAI